MSIRPSEPRPFIATACVCCNGQSLSRSPAVLMPFVAHRIFGWRPVRITEDWGLRTVEPGMAYSICNSMRCDDCGHLFLDMRFTDDQMATLYRNYQDDAYAALREIYEPGYIQRNIGLKKTIHYLDQVEAFLAPHLPARPRILDWGGSRGQNTPFPASRACHHIFDISGEPPVEGGVFVDREAAFENDYDLVVCSNVLEHLPYPIDTLQDLRRTLGPQTLLYLELPYENIQRQSADHPDALATKKHWHEHINFYSRRSLKTLLDRAGIAVIDERLGDVGERPDEFYNFFLACRLA